MTRNPTRIGALSVLLLRVGPERPPKSRMWESRLSGSVRGVGGNW